MRPIFVIASFIMCGLVCGGELGGETALVSANSGGESHWVIVFPESLSPTLSLLGVLGGITSVGVSYVTMKEWRNEHIGRRKIDFTEEILALLYASRSAIKEIRSPFGYVGEGGTRKREEGEIDDESYRRDMAYVAFERYYKHADTFNRLNALQFRFMVIYGSEYESDFESIQKTIGRILYASQCYYGRMGTENNDEKLAKCRSTIWEQDENDNINNSINAVINKIETVCKKTLLK